MKLRAPASVVLFHGILSDDKEVDIAIGTHVVTYRRSEDRGIRRGDPPLGQSVAKSVDKRLERGRNRDDVFRYEVISIQPIRLSGPDIFHIDDALFGKAVEGLPHPVNRVPTDDSMQAASGEGAVCASQRSENVPVDRRGNDTEGAMELHADHPVGRCLL